MKNEQPDLLPAPAQVPMPVAGEIPIILSQKTLRAIARIEGLTMAKDAIKNLKSPLPGLSFALSAIDCEIHEFRTNLFLKLTRQAAQAVVNMTLHGVVGVESKDGVEYQIALQSFEEMEGGK